MQKPTIGRFVRYRLSETEVRPALIVQDWGGQGTCNLQVFLDGSNDGPDCSKLESVTLEEAAAGIAWRTSIIEGDKIGQWAWPEIT